MVKRTRPFAYTFRVSEQEKNLIDGKVAKSGLTMREFILRSITNKPVLTIVWLVLLFAIFYGMQGR